MILHLTPNITDAGLHSMLRAIDYRLPLYCFRTERHVVLSGALSADDIPPEYRHWITDVFDIGTSYPLASRAYSSAPVEVCVGDIVIGGGNVTALVAGPCSVESYEQADTIASHIKSLGLHIMRAGAYKPRTSIYSFQGLGKEGIDILRDIKERHKLLVLTEVCQPSQLDDVLRVADIVQVGAKSMYDYQLLCACAEIDRPVLLKRHYASRVEEFAQMAELLLSRGKEDVMLCERGIRSFETSTRFTLDLCAVEWLKANLRLPIFVDPSHAMGHAYGVAGLARAGMALGVDGILIEAHNNPQRAMSDSQQQIDLTQLTDIHQQLSHIGKVQ